MTRHWYINVDGRSLYYGEGDLPSDTLDVVVTGIIRDNQSAVVEFGYEECSDFKQYIIEDGDVIMKRSVK